MAAIDRASMSYTLCIVIAGGIASHVLYFVKGEHHMQAPRIALLYIALSLVIFTEKLAFGNSRLEQAAIQSLYIITAHAFSLFTSIAIYRLFFHRTRSFPGPFLAGLSKFWHVIHSRNSQNHLLMCRLYEQYGDFVRIGMF